MVFTVRCILGYFLVLLSITIIHPASISLRSTAATIQTNNNATQNNTIDQQVKAAVNLDLEPKTETTTQIVTTLKRGTVKYTTLPTVEENKIKSDDVEKNIDGEIKAKDNEKEVILSTTLSTPEDNKIKKDDVRKDKNSGENKVRTENGRALEFDISKYTSPEFQSKNNVYSLPTSPENEKYINPDFIPKPTTFKPSDFKSDLTTPRSDFFDQRFHDVEHGVQQDLDRIENDFFKEHRTTTLEDLIEKSKNNDTKTKLNVVTFNSHLDENKTQNNSIHKNFETSKGLLLNFNSSYNDTKTIDEVVKIPITTTKLEPVLDNKIKIGDVQERTERSNFASTTRRNYPTKLSQANKTHNSLISNKIEAETLKPIEPKSKEVEVLPKSTPIDYTISVNKRGSTKYFDSFTTTEISKKFSSKYLEQPTTVSVKNNIANEQNVQENNIYPVIVPVPSTESNTIKMFEMTEDEEEMDTSTESTTSFNKNEAVTESNTELTLAGPKEEYFEMTSDFTTLVSNTMIEITTDEMSTTKNGKLDVRFEERDVRFNTEDSTDLSTETLTELSTIIPNKLELMEETMSTTTSEKLEETMDTTLNPTEDKTTEESLSTTEIPDKKSIDETETTFEISTVPDSEKTTDQTTNLSAVKEDTTNPNSVEMDDTTNIPATEESASTILPTIVSITTENLSVTKGINNNDEYITDSGLTTDANAIGNITTLEITTIKPTTVSEVLSYDTTLAEEPAKSEKPNNILVKEVETSTVNSITAPSDNSVNETKTTTENINVIDPKENDIIKENSTKLNRTDITLANAEIDEDNEEIGEEMEYIELQNRKLNKTNADDVEIVHIDQMERTTVRTETKTVPVTHTPRVNSTTDFFTVENEIEGVTEENKLEGEGNSGTVIAIVISTVGAICLIALAGLLFVMRRRQKRFNYGQRCTPVSLDSYSMDNVSAHNSVRRKGIIRGSKRSYGNPAFDDSSISHPLNFQGISKYSTNSEDICAEFEEIPQVTARMNELPEGCDTKNRYANVIPLPETRVLLSSMDDDPTSDYINANYVTGPKGVRGYYIACQAPLQSTVNDFWRMIWEQQSKVILMLTHMYENGVEKCVDYLPPSEVLDCHRLFGDFQITLKKREVKDKYIISSLQLKNMVSNSWREITHLWYSGWPEKGVPTEENSLIAFLIEARSYVKLVQNNPDLKMNDVNNGNGGNPDVSPVVVHCSPGTGRTGTVIACDIAIREFEMKRVVDIPKIVYKIRRDRASAVQTKEQYEFIYRVINMYATKLTGGVLDSI